MTDSSNETAELTIAVRPDFNGRGLGGLLLEKLIRYCEGRETGTIVGRVRATNRSMLELARGLGFEVCKTSDVEELELRRRTRVPPELPR